jgi:hypothetical protein
MAFTRSPASAEKTKPGNPSYFGFKEAGPESDEVLDAKGNRRCSTVAFAVAKPMRDREVKQRTTFKIDQMTVQEWIGINMKAFPLLFVPHLLWADGSASVRHKMQDVRKDPRQRSMRLPGHQRKAGRLLSRVRLRIL